MYVTGMKRALHFFTFRLSAFLYCQVAVTIYHKV